MSAGDAGGGDRRPSNGSARRPARRSEKVAESVARDIVRDATGLPPGSILPSESSMLQRYDVSRGSLREALRILEVQGLIVLKPGPGGGPVLVGPDSRDLGRTETLFFHLLGARYKDLLVAMVQLEPMIARMAAELPGHEQLDRLRPFVDEPLPSAEDTEGYRIHSDDFHRAIPEMCGNPVLALLVQSLRDILRDRIGPVVFTDKAEREEIVQIHAAVAKAVLNGRGARAEKLMRDHMERFSEVVLESKAGLVNEIVDWH
jgi:GntR family transcriptional regulator, transcriptional repressor for pyruvate dehydrogenase complex